MDIGKILPINMLQFHSIAVTAFAQNATILWCSETRSTAIVDPGGDLDRLTLFIREQNLRLEKILLTHGHVDHAGGAQILADALSIPIFGPHVDDQFWLDCLVEQAQRFGLREQVRNCKPTRTLSDGELMDIGKETLTVIHTPGHTPGHIVFFDPPSKLAIVGDVLFQGSIGRTDFPRGDHPTLIHSIRHKLFPLGDDVQFICGHGPMSTFGAERAHNPYVGDFAVL